MGLPELKLKQDVVTRWNSTFDMLQRFYKLKEAIISTLAILDTQHEQLSSHDWIIVEKTIDILEIFYDITNEISAENNVSLSKVIVLCKIMIRHVNKKLNEEGTSGPIEIRLLLNTLRQQLNDRFKNVENNALYAEATILDPRFKKYGFRDENMCKIAINNLKKKNYLAMSSAPQCASAESNEETIVEPTTSKNKSIWEDFDTELNSRLRPQNQTAAGIRELDKYIDDEMLPRTYDPLKWWEERKRIYPMLYNFMLKRLCIVVPCERVFSKAGHILNERRTSLKDDKVNKILFLNCNMKE